MNLLADLAIRHLFDGRAIDRLVEDVRLGHRAEQGGPVVFTLDRLRALAQERGDRLVAGLPAQPDDAGLEAFIRPIRSRFGGIRSGLRWSLSLLGTGERLHEAVAYDTGGSLRLLLDRLPRREHRHEDEIGDDDDRA